MAVAYVLREAGLGIVLLEQEDRVGEPWRRRHAQLTLNTHRDLSTLPGVAYREGTRAFPHKSAVIEHFEDFVRHHDLPIAYGVKVQEITRQDGVWAVETDRGTRLARHVVVATGRDRHLFLPEWKGTGLFDGRLVHAADFGDARDYEGKAVLVVGAGNSGFDVLNHLVGVRTGPLWLSVRRGPTILPKRISKVAVHKLSPFIAALPEKLADTLIAVTQRLVFGDLAKYGLPPAPQGGVSRLGSDYTAIAADDGAIAAIKSGRIKVVPEIREFRPGGVILADGGEIHPDIVIAATGYRTGLDEMVGRLDVLDGKGVPRFNGDERDPRYPGLWFTGMRPSIRGCFRNAVIQAQAIAKAIARSQVS